MISVIMPVFNAEKYLSEAIESILYQTYNDFELIIVNDGSTDSSKRIIEYYQNRDGRIKCINQENAGVAAALNRALNIATGEYILRMDADDVSYKHRLEKVKFFMDEHMDIDVCGSYSLINGKRMQVLPTEDKELKIYTVLFPPFIHPTVCFRKQFLDKYSIRYKLVAAEDYDLWTRIMDVAKFANIPEPLLMYRVYGGNISLTNNSKIIRDDFRVKSDMYHANNINFIPKHHFDDNDFNEDDAVSFLEIISFFIIKYQVEDNLPIEVIKRIALICMTAETGMVEAYHLFVTFLYDKKVKVSLKNKIYFWLKAFQKKLGKV